MARPQKLKAVDEYPEKTSGKTESRGRKRSGKQPLPAEATPSREHTAADSDTPFSPAVDSDTLFSRRGRPVTGEGLDMVCDIRKGEWYVVVGKGEVPPLEDAKWLVKEIETAIVESENNRTWLRELLRGTFGGPFRNLFLKWGPHPLLEDIQAIGAYLRRHFQFVELWCTLLAEDSHDAAREDWRQGVRAALEELKHCA